MNGAIRRGVAALVAALALAAYAPDARAIGEAAADFSLKDLKGRTVRLADYSQKGVVVLSFWATWCQPCMAEMPHLEAMYKELKGSGLTVLSVNTDEARNHALVKSTIQQKGYTFPVLLDQNTQVITQYNPRGMIPYTVVIGRDGRVKAVHAGYSPGDETALEEEVKALLAADPGPPRATPPSP